MNNNTIDNNAQRVQEILGSFELSDNLVNNHEHIAQGTGKKRASLTLSINTSNEELITRQIFSVDSSEDLNSNNDISEIDIKTRTFQFSTFCIGNQIRLLVKFIKAYIDSDFNDDCLRGERTIKFCLQKLGELHEFIMKQGPEICVLYNKFCKGAAYEVAFNEESKKFELDVAIKRNITFSFSSYKEIFLKYYEFSCERKNVCSLSLDRCVSGGVINGFDKLIDKAIGCLIKIRDEKYYSLFRVILNLKNSIDLKAEHFLRYIGMIPSYAQKELSSDELYWDLVHESSFSNFSNVGCYVVKLQILIDLLVEVKKSSKTIGNLKIVVEQCENCLNYYKEDLPHYKEWQRQDRENNIPFINDYYEVKLCLEKLHEEFSQLKLLASFGAIDKGPQKGKRKQPQGKKKQKPAGQSQGKLPKKAETQDIQKLNKIETIEKVVDNKELQLEVVEKVVLESSSEEESFEWEASEFFEEFRQLIEKDRRAKWELKEAKLTLKLMSKVKEDVIVTNNNNGPEVVKLTSDNQLVLDALFSGQDCHLKFTEGDIENLIRTLKGRVEGVGGSKYRIFWGNSNKKAGKYEVLHGGDNNGKLTHEWAQKVREAIQVGVQHGYIARETSSCFRD